MKKLRKTLNKNSQASALALKELLGTVFLEPVLEEGSGAGKRQRAHHVAQTKVQTLALLDEGLRSTN